MSKRIFHLICSLLIFASFIYVIIPQFASAATSCDPPEYFSTSFLGFNAWYSGLRKKHANGAIGESVCPEEFSEQSLSGTVIRIVLNVLGDLMFAAGILAVGFVIYSGFMLITAGGEVGKVEKAKSNLTAAITGTVIAMLGTVIVSLIRVIFWK